MPCAVRRLLFLARARWSGPSAEWGVCGVYSIRVSGRAFSPTRPMAIGPMRAALADAHVDERGLDTRGFSRRRSSIASAALRGPWIVGFLKRYGGAPLEARESKRRADPWRQSMFRRAERRHQRLQRPTSSLDRAREVAGDGADAARVPLPCYRRRRMAAEGLAPGRRGGRAYLFAPRTVGAVEPLAAAGHPRCGGSCR